MINTKQLKISPFPSPCRPFAVTLSTQSDNSPMQEKTKAVKTTLLIFALIASLATSAATPNERQARAFFDRAYRQVFGPQGSTLTYAVNIIGIYKTAGTIWYKGRKQAFTEKRYSSWNDGRTFYRADNKRKTVEIFNPGDPGRDKYASKFTFAPDDYVYHVSDTPEGYLISLDAKEKAKSTIKHAKALVDKRTFAPLSLRIKVAFFWTTIHISRFRSGGINDNIFVFPSRKYSGWKTIDHR